LKEILILRHTAHGASGATSGGLCGVRRAAVLGCLLAMVAGLGAQARRVVCMAPAFTEICFALGQGGRVVGVTDFCEYPPEARRLASVGGFLNPNREAILRLNPDLVLVVPEEAELAEQLRSLGIRVEVIPLYELSDIAAAMGRIGALLGLPEAGRRLESDWRREIRALASPESAPAGPRTLLVVGRNAGELSNIYVAGPKTFLGELLRRAGGRNAYQGEIRYPSLSLEGIARLDPQVVIELYPGMGLTAGQKARLAGDWRQLPDLSACKSGRVFVLDDPLIAIPGPRVGGILKKLKACLR